VVYSSSQGNSPEAIQREFLLLRQPEIYGAIAFYLDHQSEIRRYLEEKERRVEEASTPLSEANPDLWARLQRARENLGSPKSRASDFSRTPI
jgi:hypothetical protein